MPYKDPEKRREHDRIRNRKRRLQRTEEQRERDREYFQAYARRYRKTPEGAAAIRRSVKKYGKTEKMKPAKRAYAAVKRALKQGKLTRQPCEVCGDPKAEAHHDDYSKRLEVRWLCRKDHLQHHQEVRLGTT